MDGRFVDEKTHMLSFLDLSISVMKTIWETLMTNLILIGIVVAVAVVVGLVSIYFWGADNPVEEACEEGIKAETGINIELSPGSSPTTPTVPPSTGNKASS